MSGHDTRSLAWEGASRRSSPRPIRPTATDGVRELPVELIAPNPNQPRRSIDGESLQALADSLGEQGVLQPVLVRPRPGGYELIAGERRWRAARLAGIERIPALVRPTDDAQTLELALIENMAREDLNPVEEARACAALAEELGLTREEIGRRVGRSRVAISNLVRLLELPDDVLEMLAQRALSEGHGRALLMAEDHDARRKLARKAAAEGWSVRTTERRARESNEGARPRAALPSPSRPRSACSRIARRGRARSQRRSKRPWVPRSACAARRVALHGGALVRLARGSARACATAAAALGRLAGTLGAARREAREQ